MINELLALRNLEKQVQDYFELKGFSSVRLPLQEALESVKKARLSDVKDDNPDSYGEMLRTHFFVGKGFGCYSTFEVRTEFQTVDKDSALGKAALKCLFSDCHWYNEPETDEYKQEIARAHVLSTPTHIVAWWWDGDGTLVVGDIDNGRISRAAINDDCKKDRYWKFIDQTLL